MRLTKKLMKKHHTELWLWLHGDSKREKSDWPRWKENGGDIRGEDPYCFPCLYSEQHERKNEDWDDPCRCPLDFPRWETTDGAIALCLGGLFLKWIKAKGKARTTLAKQIAELPIRKRR